MTELRAQTGTGSDCVPQRLEGHQQLVPRIEPELGGTLSPYAPERRLERIYLGEQAEGLRGIPAGSPQGSTQSHRGARRAIYRGRCCMAA